MVRELRLEVNKACNYRCVHCYTDKRAYDGMTPDATRALIREIADLGGTDLSLTGGEPLLAWEQVLEIARFGKSVGLRVRINTNGHLLTERRVPLITPLIDEFQISLNGATAEAFDAFVNARGAFKKVTGGIRRVLAAGGNVTIRYSLTGENAHELEPTFRLGEEMGVQSFKVRVVVPAWPIPAIDKDELDAVITATDAFFSASEGSPVEVRFNDGGLGLTIPERANSSFLKCLCGEQALFVGADGVIAPCTFLREYPAWNLGDARQDALLDVIHTSAKLKEFIGNDVQSGCGNSSSGCRATDICLLGPPQEMEPRLSGEPVPAAPVAD